MLEHNVCSKHDNQQETANQASNDPCSRTDLLRHPELCASREAQRRGDYSARTDPQRSIRKTRLVSYRSDRHTASRVVEGSNDLRTHKRHNSEVRVSELNHGPA